MSSQVTKDDINALNAKLIKAELRGDQKSIEEIKEKLKKVENGNQPEEEETVVKYYTIKKPQNDEKMSVKDMFLAAKRSDMDSETRLFVASCSRNMSANPDDEYESERKKKKAKLDTGPKIEFVKQDAKEECKLCVKNLPRILVLSTCEDMILTLPPHEPFLWGQCFIQSKTHELRCTVSADENALEEITSFQKLLTRMFESKGLVVVFMELYKRRKSSNKHLIIECIPIEKNDEAEARMYFKKAIMECEGEWSMNKKLVEMKGRSVTKVVPKGLSYFSVSFGDTNDGFCHVIEDDEVFPQFFGIEILGGLLDIEPQNWRKPRHQSYEKQCQRFSELKTLLQKSL